MVCHHNCDICVLRNGKAKKNDEPIPDDLAPISGGKPKKKQEEPTFSTYLEPVMLRKDASTLAPQTTSEEDEQRGKLRRRNPKGKKSDQAQERRAAKQEKPAPKAEKVTPKAEKPATKTDKPTQKQEKSAPKADKPVQKPADAASETAAAPKPKNNNHHRYYRKRRKPGSGNKPET